MSYQPKVKYTDQYINNSGEEVPVTNGIVRLVEQIGEKQFPCVSTNMIGNDWRVTHEVVRSPRTYYKPIVVSDIEDIERKDWVYHRSRKQLFKVGGFGSSNGSKTFNPLDEIDLPTDKYKLVTDCDKILILPDNFSITQLEAIANGSLRHEEEVLVKCSGRSNTICSGGLRPMGEIGGKPPRTEVNNWHVVDLNENGHATFYIIDNNESVEQASLRRAKERGISLGKSLYLLGFEDGVDWKVDNS